MASGSFTLDELKQILLGAAGAVEGVELNTDALDTEFDELGYDSLALLELGGQIEQRYEISLDEEAVGEARTPRALIDVVNAHLTSSTAA